MSCVAITRTIALSRHAFRRQLETVETAMFAISKFIRAFYYMPASTSKYANFQTFLRCFRRICGKIIPHYFNDSKTQKTTLIRLLTLTSNSLLIEIRQITKLNELK